MQEKKKKSQGRIRGNDAEEKNNQSIDCLRLKSRQKKDLEVGKGINAFPVMPRAVRGKDGEGAEKTPEESGPSTRPFFPSA